MLAHNRMNTVTDLSDIFHERLQAPRQMACIGAEDQNQREQITDCCQLDFASLISLHSEIYTACNQSKCQNEVRPVNSLTPQAVT